MSTPRHRSGSPRRPQFGRSAFGWSRRSKLLSAVVGALLAGGVAYAASSWTVGLGSGSSGEAQGGTVSNITIVASASPAATNLLYPGTTGDVVATITNPNKVAVTITALSLPSSSTYATGYSDSGLSTAVTGCSSSTSVVSWSFASTGVSSHTLTSAITLAANSSQTITFTNAATMGLTTPAACQSAYFSMPSLSTVTATAGAATATTATTNSWTS